MTMFQTELEDLAKRIDKVIEKGRIKLKEEIDRIFQLRRLATRRG